MPSIAFRLDDEDYQILLTAKHKMERELSRRVSFPKLFLALSLIYTDEVLR